MDILKEDLQIAFYSRIIDIYKSNLIRKNIRHEEARTEIERIFSICSIFAVSYILAKILDKSLFEEVIKDLESLDFKSTLLLFAANDPNFNLYGYVIKIMYDSGVYQLVSNAGAVYTYDSNGYLNSFHSSVKEDVWNSLIIKYIGEEEFNQHKLSF